MLDCPKEILIGIQGKSWDPEEYDGKKYYPLAYVTYIKEKKVYKETSFDSWRNKELGTKTYDNTPQQGFTVLFNVGGCKSGWNVRQTYFRVRDPRGFEFEISSSNFVDILQNETITNGVLSGKYAYVWEGQNLNLIKDDDPVYIEGVINNTALNDENEKVTKDNIIIGQGYRLRDYSNGYYIGRLPWKTYRGETNANEYGRYLPKTEYNSEEQLMYTFVVETEGYDDNWKMKKMKALVGYKEIRNVKFKNANNVILKITELEDEIANFYNSRVGKLPETIDWGYEYKKEKRLEDEWTKKYNPEYYLTYDEWVKEPIKIASNQKYVRNWFVVNTGDPSHFISVISFKFKDGKICNYIFEEGTFSPEKIIIDKQILPYDQRTLNGYYCRTNLMNHYNYEAYEHYKIKEFTDVDKLMPCYGMYNLYIGDTAGTYNGKKLKLTVNIQKSYCTVKYSGGINE